MFDKKRYNEETFQEAYDRFISDLQSGASMQPSMDVYPVPLYDVARNQHFERVLKINGVE